MRVGWETRISKKEKKGGEKIHYSHWLHQGIGTQEPALKGKGGLKNFLHSHTHPKKSDN